MSQTVHYTNLITGFVNKNLQVNEMQKYHRRFFFDNAFIFQIGMNLYIAHSAMSGLIFYKKKREKLFY